MLHSGYAQAVITPSLDRAVFLAGFGQNRRAVAVHDDLYVRALALVQGDTRLVLVALDLLGLARPHCQTIEQRLAQEYPGVQLMITCTHTHHGPDTIGFWGPSDYTSGVDPHYLNELQDKVVSTACHALARLQPVHLRAAAIQATGLAKNARDPEILDEELSCLQWVEIDQQRVHTTLLVYPCHPEVLWNDNTQITADYLYTLREVVEAETGAPCLVMVGALGGMMTPNMGGQTFDHAAKMGLVLGKAALRALNTQPAKMVQGMAYQRLEFSIPRDNPLFELAVAAGVLTDRRGENEELVTEASLLRLDQSWLFFVPGELLPKLGLAFKGVMKQRGAAPAIIVGLANDELGYILPAEEFSYPQNMFDPGAHYEETMSIGPAAGPRLQAVFQQLLENKNSVA